MRVAVTGATGTLGTSLLDRLQADPDVDEVVGIARRPPRDWRPDKVRWVAADIAEDDLDAALAGADAVVHLAWLINPSRDRGALRRTNVAGSLRVFDAARRAGARALVHASSIGTYAPGPKDRLVDESWPAHGIAGFAYSEDKVLCERALDALEREHPAMRVVRMRPTLALKRASASHLRRELAGAWLPGSLVRPELLPLVPRHPRLRTQIAHADDVAEAFRLAVHADVRGPFNVAAGPIVDGPSFAARIGARTVPVPVAPVKALHLVGHALRIVPGEPGWTDELLCSPLVDTARAERELGWRPERSSFDALWEVLDGLRTAAGAPTPALDPAASGPLRVKELAASGGARQPG